ncbi:hypothetical protein EMPS_11543 [Entomortierella parvispora]|uniref:Methyltransferase domain-containing protein n=1 Tax=Entomortierella parvispora TaxID=205924 RepID=A0A9P3HLY4_9FUNG|nr:hypothetical protein EMPS_11543 [Entomortierella parvispora]
MEENTQQYSPLQLQEGSPADEHDLGMEIGQEDKEEEYDRYKDNPDLLNETQPHGAGGSRLFSYDWASGFVSPFRPTPQNLLETMLQHVEFQSPGQDTLLDLGCGDGLVLRQALETFPPSKLKRAIGVDLDKALLEQSRDTFLTKEKQQKAEGDPILSRLELYYGDIIAQHDPLLPIMVPTTQLEESNTATMEALIRSSSHVFVYLLPEALSKLAPLLIDVIESKKKVVLSMRWEIPELQRHLVCGGSQQQFYIYRCS